MPKRANREGTVRYRSWDDRWEARYYLNGEGKSRSAYGKTQGEAIGRRKKILRNAEEGLSTGTTKPGKDMTVEEYLKRWLAGPRKRSVALRTYEDYKYRCEKYLIPEIGWIKLSELTAEDLDDLYGEKSDESLGPRSVNYIHQTIRVALGSAVKKRLLPYNVARDAEPPSMARAERREYKTLSQAQVEKFFKAAAEAEDRFEALFVLAVCAGPRPGEVLALKWEDLYLPEGPEVNGEARIRHSLSETKEKGWILRNTTKTGNGRPVLLFPEVVGALRAHRKRYLEERELYAEIWLPTWQKNPDTRDLVFPNKVGGFMDRGKVDTRHFKQLLKRAGLPKIRLYDLRHTFSTLWLEAGEHPKVLQEILGHSRISMTLDTYSHVTPHMQTESFGRFRKRFGGAS